MEYKELEANILARPVRSKALRTFCIMTLTIALIFGVLNVVSLYAYHKQHDAARHGKELKCYECIFFHGWNWSNAPLPFEENCELDPVNQRLCGKDEICFFGKSVSSNRTRVQRSCYGRKKAIYEKALGCVREIGNLNQTFCFCDANLCKIN